ncbi:hypothetical protein [Cellulomonas sp. URHE0023]|uniref:hypothetical protein n=1 Tax=Cellulomonas sp. URHE0023 TaxID=1380354 RepID=UPI000484E63C|nr:hypothetical protein [Cellulomonas sp. URHE0023]
MNHDEHTVGRHPRLRFVQHAVEMVVAMVAGMVLLEPVWSFAWPGLHESTTAHVMVMATNMSLGMAVWMRVRGHGLALIAEMVAAMYVPFLLLLPVSLMGSLTTMGLMTVGHVLMVLGMLAVMLRHRHAYGW